MIATVEKMLSDLAEFTVILKHWRVSTLFYNEYFQQENYYIEILIYIYIYLNVRIACNISRLIIFRSHEYFIPQFYVLFLKILRTI